MSSTNTDSSDTSPALKRFKQSDDDGFPYNISTIPMELDSNYSTTSTISNHDSQQRDPDEIPPFLTPAHKSPLLFQSYDELTNSYSTNNRHCRQTRSLYTRSAFQFRFGLPLVFLFFGTGSDEHIRAFE